ncbi:hypothetical protein BJX61DRAFT_128457 [Aspergillus egyptiacus]|nr:hypothetical protein BJX61DRAFT_128457 [Aspergillus egyptiacus]
MDTQFAPDCRDWSLFSVQPYPDEKAALYNPPTYYTLPTVFGYPASSCTPNFPQIAYTNSLQHIQTQYNYLLTNVVGNALLQAEQEAPSIPVPLPYSPPSREEYAISPQYPSSQTSDDLQFGSDSSFSPTGYQPPSTSPPQPETDQELAYLYKESIQPLSHQTPVPSPIPETAPHSGQELQLAALSQGGIQKITGKKRRRLLHIIAERNRRLSQNKMYDELYRMVPGLENTARRTKRDVLNRTADFLEGLLEENKRLEGQLRQLQLANCASG